MKRLVSILLLLSLPALLVPCGFAVCICKDCSCAKEKNQEMSCCAKRFQAQKKGKRPSCSRLSVKGVEGLTVLGNTAVQLDLDVLEQPILAFLDVASPPTSISLITLAVPQQVPPAIIPLVI